jgi:predicted dehydrogenase
MAFTPERDGNTIRRVAATTPVNPRADGRVRWGVLGVAKIATEQVIPAMQQGQWSEITAIASRDAGRARAHATALGIPRSYGSYEALLDDPDVEAIYNPLPNHLHVPWTMAAAERGKHVLCEKPIGLSSAEAEEVLRVGDRTGVTIQEAFMVWTHPQWIRARRARPEALPPAARRRCRC